MTLSTQLLLQNYARNYDYKSLYSISSRLDWNDYTKERNHLNSSYRTVDVRLPLV